MNAGRRARGMPAFPLSLRPSPSIAVDFPHALKTHNGPKSRLLGKRYTLGNFKPLLLSQIRAAGNMAS